MCKITIYLQVVANVAPCNKKPPALYRYDDKVVAHV